MSDMRKDLDKFKQLLNEGASKQVWVRAELVQELNDGRNSLVKIRCMQGNDTEAELVVFTQDIKRDGPDPSSTINKF